MLFAVSINSRQDQAALDELDGRLDTAESGKVGFTWLTARQGVVGGGTATDWTSVDCSAAVPVGTKAVILHIEKIKDGFQVPVVYVRESSANAAELLTSEEHDFAAYRNIDRFMMVGLDSARNFDWKMWTSKDNPSVNIGIVGYFR